MTVAAIAGNHDSARRQDAHSPLWERAGVHVVGGIVSNALYDVENSENIESSNPDTEAPCSVLAESDGILRENIFSKSPGAVTSLLFRMPTVMLTLEVCARALRR